MKSERMSLARWLRRRVRRLAFAGVDFILDHELAALRFLHETLPPEHKDKFAAQMRRYDRIDRSSTLRKQKFIDDDSDFRRSDWPVEILFENPGGTAHSADIVMRHRTADRLSVKAKAFLVWGRFDGFEFAFSRAKPVVPKEYPLAEAVADLSHAETDWLKDSVTLFRPFGPEKSAHEFIA